VIDQIVAAIRSGDIEQGDALPGERQLAARMEVSRRTVRDAIKALAEAGVIDVRSSGGMTIASIWIPPELTQRAAELSAEAVYQALEARRTVEPRIAQLAAIRAADGDFASMRKAIELQREIKGDPLKMYQADSLFHRAMWRAAYNELLEKMMNILYEDLQSAFDMGERTPSDAEYAITLHEQTLAALISADRELVEQAMDEHLRYMEDISEEVFGRPRRRLPPEVRTARLDV
jgi:DNA-binding FadR family transcriptional regulator